MRRQKNAPKINSIPPFWRMPLIDNTKKERPTIQPEMPMVPPDWKPQERPKPEEAERGVYIVQL